MLHGVELPHEIQARSSLVHGVERGAASNGNVLVAASNVLVADCWLKVEGEFRASAGLVEDQQQQEALHPDRSGRVRAGLQQAALPPLESRFEGGCQGCCR